MITHWVKKTTFYTLSWSLTYAGPLCLGASPQSSGYPRMQVWWKWPKHWVVSFTDTSKHLIYLQTLSICACVRHWWRGDYLYELVLPGASTIMTTLWVWHNIMCNYAKLFGHWGYPTVLCSKQLKRLMKLHYLKKYRLCVACTCVFIQCFWEMLETKYTGNQRISCIASVGENVENLYDVY